VGIAEEEGFVITRPTAALRARVLGSGTVRIRQARLDLPEEYGIFPFLEAESAPALEHAIVTAAVAAHGKNAPEGLSIRREGDEWTVSGKREGKSFTVVIDASGENPVVEI
jgi:hypothetical protein